MVAFSHLSLSHWRQFDNVFIEFHPRLTVITGSNGSGKSTLLNLLSQHLGVQRNYLATPKRTADGSRAFFSGIFDGLKGTLLRNFSQREIGTIGYSNRASTPLLLSDNNSLQFAITIRDQQHVEGFFISPYKSPVVYRALPHMRMQAMSHYEAYSNFTNESNSRYQGNPSEHSSIYRIKEALFSMAVYGGKNEYFAPDIEAQKTFLGFIEILKAILPEGIGFKTLELQPPDLILSTNSGDFLIDAVSGGIVTLIEIAWQIYLYSLQSKSFTVVMDEPENHLHPAMQRSLMRNLLVAFPDVQFIIATHSPFMVTSVKEANVYALRYLKKGSHRDFANNADINLNLKISSQKLDNVNKASSAAETLRDVLGLTSTMPIWVENEIDSLVLSQRSEKISPSMLLNIRHHLEALGYEEFYPEAIAKLVRLDDKTQ